MDDKDKEFLQYQYEKDIKVKLAKWAIGAIVGLAATALTDKIVDSYMLPKFIQKTTENQ